MVRRRAGGRGRLGTVIATAVIAGALASPTAAQLVPVPSPPVPTTPLAATTTAPPPTTAAPTTAAPTAATTGPALRAATVSAPTTAATATTASTAAPTTVTTGLAPITTVPPPPTTTSTSTPPTTAAPLSSPTSEATTTTAAPSGSTTTSTTKAGPPAASLSEASVRSYLDAASRSGTNNSTNALLDALRPLYELGLPADEIIAKGFGRFPVGAQAYFRDDFNEYRAGPPEHGHQGTDIFAAFNAPVRSPANGIVTFADEGLGGKAAYVTEPDGTFYYMAHLNGFAPGVRHGSPVTIGQVVGFNGDSGNAKGGAPHVHFEVHPRGGAAINPKPLLDQWLLDALASIPEVVRPVQEVFIQATRPMSALSVTRALDRRLRAEPNPMEALSVDDDDRLAAAFVAPLTPPALRRDDPRPTLSL